MAEIKKRWYVLRVIGGKEKKVKEYIENEVASLGLQDYVSQVLIPTEKIYQVRNGKKISKERNFFPGYVNVSYTPLTLPASDLGWISVVPGSR